MSVKWTVQKPVMLLDLPSALDLGDLILLEYDMILFQCSFSMTIKVVFLLRCHLE